MGLVGTPATLQEEFEYISMYDDALDHEAEDFSRRWKLYNEGKGEAPLKDGATPTVFVMSHLSRAAFNRVRQLGLKDRDVEAWELAARATLKEVRGKVGGKEIEVEHVQDGSLRLVTKACIEKIPWTVVDELGQLVFQKAVLSGK